ncbi:MAG: DNA repair protein RecO [Magnetococcales bacterium]|nr:DNA repair protein RecO [Magnetococcales bacterium]
MLRSDEGVVLRRTPFGDTSLVLHLFSREQGLLTVVARGVRAQNKRSALDRAALAGFHTLSFSHRSRSPLAMATLTQVEIGQPRHRLLHHPPALLAAQVMQEILYRFLAPQDPHPAIFNLLEQSWDGLEAGEAVLPWLAYCQSRLLQEIGYGWRCDSCAVCGRPHPLSHFSVKRNQTLCHLCVAPHLAPQHPPSSAVDRHGTPLAQRLFPLSAPLLSTLQQLPHLNQPASLPDADHSVLYQIGSACLSRLQGKPLFADQAVLKYIENIHVTATPAGEPCANRQQ